VGSLCWLGSNSSQNSHFSHFGQEDFYLLTKLLTVKMMTTTSTEVIPIQTSQKLANIIVLGFITSNGKAVCPARANLPSWTSWTPTETFSKFFFFFFFFLIKKKYSGNPLPSLNKLAQLELA
jgi:hypothetical protein